MKNDRKGYRVGVALALIFTLTFGIGMLPGRVFAEVMPVTEDATTYDGATVPDGEVALSGESTVPTGSITYEGTLSPSDDSTVSGDTGGTTGTGDTGGTTGTGDTGGTTGTGDTGGTTGTTSGSGDTTGDGGAFPGDDGTLEALSDYCDEHPGALPECADFGPEVTEDPEVYDPDPTSIYVMLLSPAEIFRKNYEEAGDLVESQRTNLYDPTLPTSFWEAEFGYPPGSIVDVLYDPYDPTILWIALDASVLLGPTPDPGV